MFLPLHHYPLRCRSPTPPTGVTEGLQEQEHRPAVMCPSNGRATIVRFLSCFQPGIPVIITTLIAQRQLPVTQFIPEPWPISNTYP